MSFPGGLAHVALKGFYFFPIVSVYGQQRHAFNSAEAFFFFFLPHWEMSFLSSASMVSGFIFAL